MTERAATPIPLSRAALLPLVLASAVLTGCSGEPASPGGTTAGGTSTAPGTPSRDPAAADAARKEIFCAEVPGLLSEITTELQGLSSPQDAPRALGQAVDRIAAVEPPADAAPQWQRLVAAWTDMRDLLTEADLQDPQANTDLAPRLQALQSELVDSGAALDEYGRTNC